MRSDGNGRSTSWPQSEIISVVGHLLLLVWCLSKFCCSAHGDDDKRSEMTVFASLLLFEHGVKRELGAGKSAGI